MAVIVPFESGPAASIDRLVEFVAADMEHVNRTILARTASDVTMIPEVANHLIDPAASGCARCLRWPWRNSPAMAARVM